MTEVEMVGWHHRLIAPEFEQTLGDVEGPGSLVCCSSWGRRVGHNLATEQQQNPREFIHVNSQLFGYKPTLMSILDTIVCFFVDFLCVRLH